MNCKLFVFRHAETYDNARKVFSGWRDSKLTKKGIVQAHKIANQLRNEKIGCAFTTHLSRAKETLRVVLSKHPKIPVYTDDRLLERCYGDLQGKSKTKWEKEHPEFHDAVHRGYTGKPLNGESIFMTEKRVKSFLKELFLFMKEHPCNIAISCHGNSLRPLRKHFEKLSVKEMCELENPHDKAMVYSISVKALKNYHKPKKKCWKSVIVPNTVKFATDKKNVLKKYY